MLRHHKHTHTHTQSKWSSRKVHLLKKREEKKWVLRAVKKKNTYHQQCDDNGQLLKTGCRTHYEHFIMKFSHWTTAYDKLFLKRWIVFLHHTPNSLYVFERKCLYLFAFWCVAEVVVVVGFISKQFHRSHTHLLLLLSSWNGQTLRNSETKK